MLPPSNFDYFYEQITWMISKISEGIEVSVETFYQPDYSNPVSGEYMFAYRITIENTTTSRLNYIAGIGTSSIAMGLRVKWKEKEW